MIYRREIDGLRAAAVVPVILFHAGFTLFSGGYVGVDVFFVISGYLITSILVGELEQGDFSIARFYERRARRILPALFFVMLCCIPFAWMWMLPSELKDFSQSVIAVVFFASNILFWREEGYFAPASELKPLLHTWSLAVEEQYYLLFPIFLLLAWRFGRNRVFWSICVIAAISLAASEWGWRYAPDANFYLASTRAWELLVGSMCAFWMCGQERRANNWLSLMGLTLIVFAIFFYDGETPFPSVYTLVPVLGTALIIAFGGADTWTGKLLSMRGFVGIGLISYSAYLWHQPLFAFARIRSILEPSPYLMATLSLLSLLLAYFSWRYIEKPFRKGKASILSTRRAVFATSGAVAALFVAAGLVGHFGDGFDSRISPKIRKILLTASASPMRNRCHFNDENRFPVEKSCSYSSENAEMAVLGNSHGVELAYSLGEYARTYGKAVAHFTISGCYPKIEGNENKYCSEFFKTRMKYISENENMKHVVIAFRYEDSDGHTFDQMIDMANFFNSIGKNTILVLQAPTLDRPVTFQLRPHLNDNNGFIVHRTYSSWQNELYSQHSRIYRLSSDVSVVDIDLPPS